MRIAPGQGTGVRGALGHGHKLRGKGGGGCRRKHLGDPQLGASLRPGWSRNAVFLKMTGVRTEARATKGVGDPGESLGTTMAQRGAHTNAMVTKFVFSQEVCALPHRTNLVCLAAPDPGESARPT